MLKGYSANFNVNFKGTQFYKLVFGIVNQIQICTSRIFLFKQSVLRRQEASGNLQLFTSALLRGGVLGTSTALGPFMEGVNNTITVVNVCDLVKRCPVPRMTGFVCHGLVAWENPKTRILRTLLEPRVIFPTVSEARSLTFTRVWIRATNTLYLPDQESFTGLGLLHAHFSKITVRPIFPYF